MTPSQPIPCILVVDDEPDIRELLEITLQRMGLHTLSAGTLREAHALLAQQSFNLCLTDMRLPDGDGIELVEHIQRHWPYLPVAVITAYGSVDTAVQALKAGAFDFISKPVELGMLRDLISGALSLGLPEDKGNTAAEDADATHPQGLLGESACMQKLKQMLYKLARSQAPVCILGESGCGKERVAREIHRLGPRAKHPFVPVNCGAIPTELMESEFFGHRKGSFSGALSDKPGLFQAAHGGTLFLDEIAELPLHMQVKLLRAIQERAVKPIGAATEVAVDVRLLSATHKDLGELVTQGRFRQDLYYRINVIELHVPPLRERLEDLPLLAQHILQRIATRGQDRRKGLSEAALLQLQSYRYPGNVRELENILERACALSDDALIRPTDLQLPERLNVPLSAKEPSLDAQLDAVEKHSLLNALSQHNGNHALAAQSLGLSPRQFAYRLQRFKLNA
ncbi:sigma-54-dependent transcriptional regulator [Thiorhodospira sibirica]|uniref:sigma-54-dependent transcriptional regulator n=1 Tax=Thiorhodospira sibirica TaxID=154347 RepID=UPI00022C4C89|nr:sigma-54 dependent transcriptional regulator [Thiorhodospira sibirica]